MFYVTSNGDGDSRVVNQKETMLRVSPSKTQVGGISIMELIRSATTKLIRNWRNFFLS